MAHKKCMRLLSAPAWAQVDLGALTHNFNQVKALTPPETKVMAVVKANAYGHGARLVSRTLVENGVDMLGVAFVDEAVRLREAGINVPIALLSGVISEEQLKQVVSLDLQPFVYTKDMARDLTAAACTLGHKVKIHIKVDTGMGRLGVSPENLREFIWHISQIQELEIAGIASHLASAEDDFDLTSRQVDIFKESIDSLKQSGFKIPCLHIANSAGILNHDNTHFNMVRPGLMLYGACRHFSLRPVLSLKSRIVFLKKVSAGTPIGYGHTYTTKSASLIAAVSIGYADGYSRLLSNRGQALVRGRRVPVVGRVCMDLSMLDVTNVPGVQMGDEVTLIGQDGNDQITVFDVADWMGTIPYEVLCLIGPRITRAYKK